MSVTLTFAAPPPGLEPLVDFTLDPVAGADGLYRLQSVAGADRRLYVLDASVYLPDYAPLLSDEQCTVLALDTPEQAQVLVVANFGERTTTVNLMAPIVVNNSTRRCSQVILDGQGWPLRGDLAELTSP
ncbi:flagellar assembly protein FliW [Paenarthrobacter sp. PH39-S1]|uniref:flagellar assembly protein FliW n=1 Tax=Paenarthrobacter sp. PH39-S1 TaxID=3046204 RepID=UPI0024BB8DC6|nr:flagellar assembly protein FliW [Paenarthrobacter sp. PH39-S1]MDJ0355968.1 flagellar assembly protein FliW [Paenarthrobacter sp. PH39-S1]